MQIFEKTLPDQAPGYPLGSISPLTDLLFFDIETTGLRKETDIVYLVGAVFFDPDQNAWMLRQWFAENPDEEKQLLDRFLGFAMPYEVLVHFNGDRFDVPFLARRAQVHDLSDPLSDRRSLDLYKAVAPWKDLLGLVDGKQQTLEKFLGTGRIEERSGKDIAAAYQEYRFTHSEGLRQMILAHNEADVCGLFKLSSVLAYNDLLNSCSSDSGKGVDDSKNIDEDTEIGRILPGSLPVFKAQANTYSDCEENPREEVLLFFRIEHELPKPLLGSRDGCLFSAEGSRGLIKVPLFEGELKYFYADYRNYWYFPEEDEALHKSVAVYADRSHRVPAGPENCYTRKNSSFLPQWNGFREPFYKNSYRDRTLYFELTPEIKKDRSFLSSYAAYVLKHIAEK
ncbi:MAG: ribonuclease H-like domain-containing protein [Lachnospiraceae bacterium]|nr:ribonuclease H-like domain-containing protein [Lachnospiraceae bacterium]